MIKYYMWDMPYTLGYKFGYWLGLRLCGLREEEL